MIRRSNRHDSNQAWREHLRPGVPLARPSVFLVHLLEVRHRASARVWELQVWGFFSVDGALAYMRREKLGRCWLSSTLPARCRSTGRARIVRANPRKPKLKLVKP